MKVKTNKPVSSFYDFHWIKEEYCIFLLSPPLSYRPSACWSLHPQTCRRRLWRARGWGVTRYAPKLTARCFIFNGAAFVSHFSRLAYGGEKKQLSATDIIVLFCWWRAEPPSRSSTPETPAGPRDSSLLPRLWDGEPQRWCKSAKARFHFSTDSILGWLLVWESRSGSFL